MRIKAVFIALFLLGKTCAERWVCLELCHYCSWPLVVRTACRTKMGRLRGRARGPSPWRLAARNGGAGRTGKPAVWISVIYVYAAWTSGNIRSSAEGACRRDPARAGAVVSMHVSLIMCRQADRILKYNLSVLQVPNDSPAEHHGPTLNCRGGQLSSDW